MIEIADYLELSRASLWESLAVFVALASCLWVFHPYSSGTSRGLGAAGSQRKKDRTLFYRFVLLCLQTTLYTVAFHATAVPALASIGAVALLVAMAMRFSLRRQLPDGPLPGALLLLNILLLGIPALLLMNKIANKLEVLTWAPPAVLGTAVTFGMLVFGIFQWMAWSRRNLIDYFSKTLTAHFGLALAGMVYSPLLRFSVASIAICSALLIFLVGIEPRWENLSERWSRGFGYSNPVAGLPYFVLLVGLSGLPLFGAGAFFLEAANTALALGTSVGFVFLMGSLLCQSRMLHFAVLFWSPSEEHRRNSLRSSLAASAVMYLWIAAVGSCVLTLRGTEFFGWSQMVKRPELSQEIGPLAVVLKEWTHFYNP